MSAPVVLFETVLTYSAAHIKDRKDELHLGYAQSALQFVDHHSSPPTHYPFGDVQDKPDFLGLFPPVGADNKLFAWEVLDSCSTTGVPHYRVETFVELKDFGNRSDGT